MGPLYRIRDTEVGTIRGNVSSQPAGTSPATHTSETTLDASTIRRVLAGFMLTGFLAALLGAILPAWGSHLRFEYVTVGHYFVGLAAGFAVSSSISHRWLPRVGIASVLVAGCVVAFAALLFLGFSAPPKPALLRVGGLFLVGSATGMLNSGLFRALGPTYDHDPAATVNLAGAFFSAGCIVAALLSAATLLEWPVRFIFLLMSVVPALFALLYSGKRLKFVAPVSRPTPEGIGEIRNPGAILLALLLFFQFGNEWSVAGWLPTFLLHRLEISPVTSLWLLAFYWLALSVGRLAVLAILPKVSHARLLFTSAGAAIFGCFLLLMTNNVFGALFAILFVGGGFASIYPLVAEKIGHRFSYYRPGLFNGIFSFAMVGATLAPASLGYLADAWDIGVVMALPLVGTCMVVVLLLLIWLESKIGG